MKNRNRRKEIKLNRFTPFIVLIVLNAVVFTIAFLVANNYKAVTFGSFQKQLANKEIVETVIQDEGAEVATLKYITKDGTKYTATGPKSTELVNELTKANVNIEANVSMTAFECFMMFAIVTTVIGYFLNIYLRYKNNKRMAEQLAKGPASMVIGGMPGAAEKPETVGKSLNTDVRLNDVAGCEEEKQEVLEIIDFLKNPKNYSEIGATIPKGVLLVGPPGTGKTLLAKAIAGEAGVHFLYASGSEFVEKYVGVGAKRIREIFESAKKQSPAILFIDEIDAIGKQRTGAEGSDERDQTLNQLLVEMDGMEENNGLIIIAATNRPEILDKAFLRKGRFDRKVAINLPDTKGREEILHVHAKKKRISSTVSLKEVAKKTHGFSGADLYAVLNEAALLAVRANHKEIVMEDVDEAIDRVMMGHSSKSKKYSEIDKKMVATHESGHVVLGLKMSEADEIDKVTIVPRGDAGGYAMLSPKEDRFLMSKEDMIEKICGLLGGRAAEELIFGKVTTGAHNDLERATNIARSMVTQYGMSDLGLVQYEQGRTAYAGYSNMSKNYSEKMAQLIDEETKKILDECYAKTKDVLNKNKTLLTSLSEYLIEKETLTQKEIKGIEAECEAAIVVAH